MTEHGRGRASPAPSAAGEAAPAVPTALRLEQVSRRFGGVTAVDGVSVAVVPGERLAVIGPNGAGKTTLFRLIAGEMSPSSGRVHLFGQDVTGLVSHRRARLGLSRTFQVSNLFAGLSVADNVRLAAQAADRSRMRFWRPARPQDAVVAPVGEVLAQVGLTSRGGDHVSDLSHGEQRQLEIAMALVTAPRLLLLDEPAAGLSSGERSRLRDLVNQLPATLPLLLIEHDMSLALELADRVLCLDNGRPIALGAPDEIRENPLVQSVYLGRAGGDAAD